MSKNKGMFLKMIDAFHNRLRTLRKTELYSERNHAFNVETVANLYKGSWIRQRIINKIVDEGVNGLSFYSEDKELPAKITKKLEELRFFSTLKKAMKSARLKGGAVILLGIQSGKSEIEPVENVKRIDYATFIPMDKVRVDQYYEDVTDAKYLQPKIYEIGGVKFHETRIIRLWGIEVDTPSDYSGFGQSVLEPVEETLKSFGLTVSGVEDIILEMTFKIFSGDIIELMKSDDDELGTLFKKRMEDFNNMLTTDGMAVIDSKETITKPVINASGIDGIIKFIMTLTSAASEMPLTKLFGQQLGTLAGATETTNDWYDTVDGFRTQYDNEISKIINAVVMEVARKIPDDFDWEWNPLYTPTATEQGDALAKHSTTVKDLYDSYLLTWDEARASLNPENKQMRLSIDYANKLSIPKEVE